MEGGRAVDEVEEQDGEEAGRDRVKVGQLGLGIQCEPGFLLIPVRAT